MSVHHSLVRHVLFDVLSWGQPAEIEAELRYNTRDPYAVMLVMFHPESGEEIEWALARNLLRDGYAHVAGIGDIEVRPFPYRRLHGEAPDRVVFTLNSGPKSYIRMSTRAESIRKFTEMIYALAPDGSETGYLGDLDELLREMIEQD